MLGKTRGCSVRHHNTNLFRELAYENISFMYISSSKKPVARKRRAFFLNK